MFNENRKHFQGEFFPGIPQHSGSLEKTLTVKVKTSFSMLEIVEC